MWGEGELKDDIQQMILDINADIRLMGTTTEVEKWLHVMDVIVFHLCLKDCLYFS